MTSQPTGVCGVCVVNVSIQCLLNTNNQQALNSYISHIALSRKLTSIYLSSRESSIIKITCYISLMTWITASVIQEFFFLFGGGRCVARINRQNPSWCCISSRALMPVILALNN